MTDPPIIVCRTHLRTIDVRVARGELVIRSRGRRRAEVRVPLSALRALEDAVAFVREPGGEP